LVVARVCWLVVLGVLAGMTVSAWGSTFVVGLLYGIPAADPLTIAGAALVLIAIAIAASWGPARRASRIDPGVLLRDN
jgi:ABC-type antimicrobial peptide transport system permease subunit